MGKCGNTFSQKSDYARNDPVEIQPDTAEEEEQCTELNRKLIVNNSESNTTSINTTEQMDISKMSKAELLEKCTELGIKKCSSKNKQQLIELIQSVNNTNEYKNVLVSEDIVAESTTTRVEPIRETTINLFNGDCLIEMKQIKSGSVDMILCDLPYGITKNVWDVIIPFDKLWEQYDRIIKDNGAVVLFGSQPFTSLMITSNLKNFRYCLVWEKNKFSDFLNAKRKPMKTNEDIAIFYKQPLTNNH